MTESRKRPARAQVSFEITPDAHKMLTKLATKNNFPTVASYIKALALQRAGLAGIKDNPTSNLQTTTLENFVTQQEAIVSEVRNHVSAVMGYMRQQAENDFGNFTTIRNLTDEVRTLTVRTLQNDSTAMKALGEMLMAVLDELKAMRRREIVPFIVAYGAFDDMDEEVKKTAESIFNTLMKDFNKRNAEVELALNVAIEETVSFGRLR
jgi:hypothetical protein